MTITSKEIRDELNKINFDRIIAFQLCDLDNNDTVTTERKERLMRAIINEVTDAMTDDNKFE